MCADPLPCGPHVQDKGNCDCSTAARWDGIENLRRLSIVRDPEHPEEHISLKTAKAIIYWDRHVAGSEDPHVVGVQHPDGTTTVFFGIITPP